VVGKYTTASTEACTDCKVGKYAATDASSACGVCSAGKYQDAAGQGYCTNCIPGQYRNDTMGGCAVCPPGRYGEASRPATNVSDCQRCQSDKVQKESGKVFCNDALRTAYVRNNEEIECPESLSKFSDAFSSQCYDTHFMVRLCAFDRQSVH
jgi:hypothetical protein